MDTYHQQLKAHIRERHGCESEHVESVPVSVFNWDNGPWERSVEVFNLTGHADARRCYAWGLPREENPGDLNLTAVLEIDPVDSAESAVIAAMLFASESD